MLTTTSFVCSFTSSLHHPLSPALILKSKEEQSDRFFQERCCSKTLIAAATSGSLEGGGGEKKDTRAQAQHAQLKASVSMQRRDAMNELSTPHTRADVRGNTNTSQLK